MVEYHWLHIPSGKVGSNTFTLWHSSEAELLRLVNKWNREGRGVWQYWIY